MSYLKPDTRHAIKAGCPEKIGMVVEVIERLGEYHDRSDAYSIKTLSASKFNQFWQGSEPLRGTSDTAIADRYKLRPTLDFKEESGEINLQSVLERNQAKTKSAETPPLILEL